MLNIRDANEEFEMKSGQTPGRKSLDFTRDVNRQLQKLNQQNVPAGMVMSKGGALHHFKHLGSSGKLMSLEQDFHEQEDFRHHHRGGTEFYQKRAVPRPIPDDLVAAATAKDKFNIKEGVEQSTEGATGHTIEIKEDHF